MTGTHTIKKPMEVMEMPAKKEAEVEFSRLYESCFPSVASFVRKMNGTLADAKDIFHDALVIYYENLADPQFNISISEEAYITGISKHLWLRKFRHDSRVLSLDAMDSAIAIPEDYFPSLNSRRLLRFLEVTGNRCLELLTAFYYEKLSAKTLVERFGYRTEHSATVQKYKCIEKAREALKSKSIVYEDFID